jgi:hypothetical protein
VTRSTKDLTQFHRGYSTITVVLLLSSKPGQTKWTQNQITHLEIDRKYDLRTELIVKNNLDMEAHNAAKSFWWVSVMRATSPTLFSIFLSTSFTESIISANVKHQERKKAREERAKFGPNRRLTRLYLERGGTHSAEAPTREAM